MFRTYSLLITHRYKHKSSSLTSWAKGESPEAQVLIELIYGRILQHVNYFSFMPFCIGWVKNFDEITLCCTVKKIEANFCFSIFGKNLKIQNGRHFWEKEIFWKLPRVHSFDTLWVENFDEIALSRTVKETEANLCFAIFGKISKIQNGRHFWGGKNFLKIAKSTFLMIPSGSKISTKSLYLAYAHG